MNVNKQSIVSWYHDDTGPHVGLKKISRSRINLMDFLVLSFFFLGITFLEVKCSVPSIDKVKCRNKVIILKLKQTKIASFF